jgi:putative oxidoreductase
MIPSSSTVPRQTSAGTSLTSTSTLLFAAALARLERFPLSIIQLAMRLGVGGIFFNAGLIKYRSWEFTVLLFRDEYQVPLLAPEVAARIAMVQELTIPILLFIGLATRLATLPFLGMLAVIQLFVYPNAWAEHLVWGSILLFLLTRGPGVFSLDHVIGRWRKARLGDPA